MFSGCPFCKTNASFLSIRLGVLDDCICCNFFFPVMMFVIPGRNCKAVYKSALSWAGPMSLSAFPTWQTARRALYRVGLGFGSSSAPVLDTWQVLDLSGSCCNRLHSPSLVPLLEHMSAVSCFLYLENLVFLSPHCEHPGN